MYKSVKLGQNLVHAEGCKKHLSLLLLGSNGCQESLVILALDIHHSSLYFHIHMENGVSDNLPLFLQGAL
jgi:hypothetical protein